MPIVVERGDITRVATDAIVNAANEWLLGGGGVDGAIHRAAGRELLDACRALPELRPGVRCPVGQARITPGFRLPARWVIHTVGPIYARSAAPATELASAFRSSMVLAREQGLRTLAFPAISCGAYGYPVRAAAKVAMQVADEHGAGLDEIRFVLFGNDVLEAFRDAWHARSQR